MHPQQPCKNKTHNKTIETVMFLLPFYTQLHLSGYTWGKKKWIIGCKHDMFWPNIQSLEYAAVVDLICFHSTKYSLQEFLDVSNIISGGKCAVSEWEIKCLRVKKSEIWAERAGQKHNKQLTFGGTVCFNSCQTLNVWCQNMSRLAPYENMIFCCVSTLRCNQG